MGVALVAGCKEAVADTDAEGTAEDVGVATAELVGLAVGVGGVGKGGCTSAVDEAMDTDGFGEDGLSRLQAMAAIMARQV